ncbi:52K protein [Barthadenovirus sternae]|nr:52K [Tern adenovirus]UJZ92506.1 52K protein [Tern atadenovirus 1]
MHPIMKNIRSTVSNCEGDGSQRIIDCGIANKGDEIFELRQQQRDDKNTTNSTLPEAVDIFRDPEPKMSEERDLVFKSGLSLDVDKGRKLEPNDFKPDVIGSNSALRHMQAAEMHRNSSHTADLEIYAHDMFMITVRQLLKHPSTKLGLLYLCDFLDNYVNSKPTHELAVQMVTLQHHIDSPVLRRIFSKINCRDDKGNLTQQWILNLINVIQMIVEEEMSVSSQLCGIGVACNKLALHFAKKASGGHYPTADKLAKTSTYFRRIIVAILNLAKSIGCYERNTTPRLPLKKSHREVETGDDAYMFSLTTALEGPESDEEDTVSEDDDDN